MIKAIAFDLGGCLIGENDIEMTPQEEILEKEFGNINSDGEYFKWATQNLSLSEEEIKSILANLWPKLYYIKEQGIFEKILGEYPQMVFAVASNHISLVRESLKHLGILDKFKVILISGNCGYEKPEKGFYQLLAEKLGVPANEILFLDNSEKNIEGAKKVGLHTIHYQRKKSLSKGILSYLRSVN